MQSIKNAIWLVSPSPQTSGNADMFFPSGGAPLHLIPPYLAKHYDMPGMQAPLFGYAPPPPPPRCLAVMSTRHSTTTTCFKGATISSHSSTSKDGMQLLLAGAWAVCQSPPPHPRAWHLWHSMPADLQRCHCPQPNINVPTPPRTHPKAPIKRSHEPHLCSCTAGNQAACCDGKGKSTTSSCLWPA